MAVYYSTKTYGNDRGLSCCFRQWRATQSHCSKLHGYAIGIKLIFASETLDDRNWVMDFGGLKDFKTWAEYMFDHTTLVAEDDPILNQLLALQTLETSPIDLRVVEAVGCEKFAELAYNQMAKLIDMYKRTAGHPINKNVQLVSVEVFEHAGNSAIYEGDHV